MKFKHRIEIERIKFLEANKESIKKIYQIIPGDFLVDRLLFILVHDSYLLSNYPNPSKRNYPYIYPDISKTFCWSDITKIFSPVLSKENELNIGFYISKFRNGDTQIIVYFFNPIIRGWNFDLNKIGSSTVILTK